MLRLATVAFLLTTFAVEAQARPCATLAYRDLMRRGNPLLGGAFGERQDAEMAGFVDSATLPLRVHYATGVADTRATLALGFLEAAWALQVGSVGFDPPLPDGTLGGDDRFDVYLVGLPIGVGARTYAEADAAADDGRHASPSFIEVDPALSDVQLEVYLHHEFNHGLQFAVDTEETALFLEMMAALFEVRGVPTATGWQDPVPAFQEFPQVSIFTNGAAILDEFQITDPRFEYGAVLFALYLDEVHSDAPGTLMRDLLMASIQPDAVLDNEPDWLDALDAEVGTAEVLLDFVGWRALVGPLAVPADGPAEPLGSDSLLAAGALAIASLDGTPVTTEEPQGPYALGCLVRTFTAPTATALPVHVTADAVDATRVLGAATLFFDATVPSATRAARPERGASIAFDIEVPAAAQAYLAICDLGAADADDALILHPITLSILRTDIEFPDAGPAPIDAGPDAGSDDPPPPPGCGCRGAHGADGAGLALMMTAALVFSRRGRQRPLRGRRA